MSYQLGQRNKLIYPAGQKICGLIPLRPRHSLLASWVLVIRKRLRSEALVESCVGNDDFMRSYSQREIWHILHDREAGIENCRVREACIALLPNVCGRAKFYALIAEI